MIDPATIDYAGVFLLMLLCTIVPPLPFEASVSAGGIAVAQGRLDFTLLVIAATAGTTVGNVLWWGLCRWMGYERLRPFVERHKRWLTFDWRAVERLHRRFDRWGGVAVFAFRFMPLGRTLISVPAGLMRMPPGRFTLSTIAGSLVWTTFLAWIGYELGLGFRDVEHWVSPIVLTILAVLAVGYVWRVLTWKPRGEI